MIDTKLARETKGGTVLQLCLYAELVACAGCAADELLRCFAAYGLRAPSLSDGRLWRVFPTRPQTG